MYKIIQKELDDEDSWTVFMEVDIRLEVCKNLSSESISPENKRHLHYSVSTCVKILTLKVGYRQC